MTFIQLRHSNQIIISLVILLSVSVSAHGQHADIVSVEKSQTTIGVNYLGVNVSQERGIGTYTTVLYGIGAHYSFYGTSYPIIGTRFINVIDKSFGRDYSTSGITPYLFLEARRYVNLSNRANQGKSTRHNSGTYIALFTEIPFATGNLIDVPNLELGNPVGIKGGLRRNVGNHLYIDGSIALVKLISSRQSSVGPRFDATLAWVL